MNMSKHLLAFLLATFFVIVGCERDDMWEQARTNTYGQNEALPNNQGAMIPPGNTVARGHLNEDDFMMKGLVNGQVATDFPMKVTKEVLLRGQSRFDIFCLPCHGKSGDGRGMIVERGFKQPEPLFAPNVATKPVGYFYGVMVNGFEMMQPGFIPPKDLDPNKPIDKVHPAISKKMKASDRWAIVAYIRAIQFSRNADVNMLSPEDLEKVKNGATEEEHGK